MESPQAPAGLLDRARAKEMVVAFVVGAGVAAAVGERGTDGIGGPHSWHAAAVPGASVFLLNHRNLRGRDVILIPRGQTRTEGHPART